MHSSSQGFCSSHFSLYRRMNLYEVCNWLTCSTQRFFFLLPSLLAKFFPSECTIWVLNYTIKGRRIMCSGAQSLAGLRRKTHWSATSKTCKLFGRFETARQYLISIFSLSRSATPARKADFLFSSFLFFLITLHWRSTSKCCSSLMMSGLWCRWHSGGWRGLSDSNVLYSLGVCVNVLMCVFFALVSGGWPLLPPLGEM